jgi:RimJ/RimL family protein N-acetyltransferase
LEEIVSLTLRQIREDDIDDFRAAIDLVAHERKHLALLQAPPVEQVRAFVRRNIENGYPQIVAIGDDKVVGWCNVPPASRAVSAHVGDLFMGLLPQWRGRGIGEQLLRYGIQAADAFGFVRIELGVFATNTAAARLYRKVGFIEEGTKLKAILIDGVFYDEIIMARLKP